MAAAFDPRRFEPAAYGDPVAAILQLGSDGRCPMPLVRAGCASEPARKLIREAGPRRLFPASRAPEAAFSGLYLYYGCWDEAHQAAQAIATSEGSYWHAIVHRQEPDASNSAYWFARVGQHPIFPALRRAAIQIGVDAGPVWRPNAFIDLCEAARQRPGSELEQKALQVQLAEWQLLFDYCARPRG